jgi:hypothetical protein
MTNEIYEKVVKHLNAGPEKRIAIAVQGGYKMRVYGPDFLDKIKPEGTGLRIGKIYVFACQVRFARIA